MWDPIPYIDLYIDQLSANKQSAEALQHLMTSSMPLVRDNWGHWVFEGKPDKPRKTMETSSKTSVLPMLRLKANGNLAFLIGVVLMLSIAAHSQQLQSHHQTITVF